MLPNLLATPTGRLIAFFALYMTEGIPLGFTATAIATQMRRQGLSPSQIGIFIGTLYLPWAWKWLAGPIVDVVYSRRFGRRRGWILLTQALMVCGLMALMPIDFTADLKFFTAMVMILNVFGATQDVAIDALACGILSEKERGLVNGVMFAGAYMGNAVGGSGVLLLTSFIGFNYTFFLVAGAILGVTLLVVLPMREVDTYVVDAEAGGVGQRIHRYALDALRAFFGTRSAIAGLAFALLPAGAYSLSLALSVNLSVELGLSDGQIGLLTLISTIVSAVGCIVGGLLSDRLGRRKMLALYLFATAIPTVYLAWYMHQWGWIMPRDPKKIDPAAIPASLVLAFWACSIAYSVFQGLMYGTRSALFMDVCTPAVAATQFTAYMAVLNLVIWYSSTWQGWSIERWGYPATLLVDALLGLVGLVLLPFMTPVRGIPTAELAEAAAANVGPAGA